MGQQHAFKWKKQLPAVCRISTTSIRPTVTCAACSSPYAPQLSSTHAHKTVSQFSECMRSGCNISRFLYVNIYKQACAFHIVCGMFCMGLRRYGVCVFVSHSSVLQHRVESVRGHPKALLSRAAIHTNTLHRYTTSIYRLSSWKLPLVSFRPEKQMCRCRVRALTKADRLSYRVRDSLRTWTVSQFAACCVYNYFIAPSCLAQKCARRAIRRHNALLFKLSKTLILV